jgi:hypothetical protein
MAFMRVFTRLRHAPSWLKVPQAHGKKKMTTTDANPRPTDPNIPASFDSVEPPLAGGAPLPLARDSFGRLVWRAGGLEQTIVPVRSFPVSAPDQGISLVNAEGHEVCWIEDLAELQPAALALITQELARREFTPEIQRILSVSSYATPSQWRVQTDRGETTFTLKGEEDIRRLSGGTLLIADHAGVHFLLRNVHALDTASRRLLDHFL